DHDHAHHHHDHEEHEHHHHHDHDGECGCEDHDHEHHHHDHDDECGCGCHDHEHHHHHADEVFSSWGLETIDAVNKEQLTAILEELAYGNEYGDVLRAKGMLPSEKEGEWYYFDMVPEQYEIRTGAPDYTGKVCVIGANLKEVELKKAFGRN
ncbi:MAG: GTP-binding protein, partial [Clostridium sp.]